MADKTHGFDSHSADRIAQAVRRVESLRYGAAYNPGWRPSDPVNWLPFRNDHSATVPPGGIMAVTGTTQLSNGEWLLTVTQPSTNFYPDYAINSNQSVANAYYGVCCVEGAAIAAYDTGTPAVGEMWGAKNGQWTLSKNYPGPVVLGVVDSSTKWVAVRCDPITHLFGKTDTTHNKNSSGDVSIWVGAAGSEADTGIDVSAYNHFANVASGKKVTLKRVNGAWLLDAAEC